MKYLRKNDAITLIALVITIIVLLILAGVAINILAGDNGILKQAAKAKGETENATIEEQAKLKDMEDLINENTEEDDYDYDAWYGDGTQTEYYIKKAIELCKLSEIVNSGKEDFDGKTIYLMSDINMNDAYNAGYTFNIIGNSDYDFRGIFDGQKHEISGFNNIESMFRNVAGTIQNLGIVNSTFSGNLTAPFAIGLGEYVTNGGINSGTIDNCWSIGNKIEGTLGAAGIVANNPYVSPIRNCYNNSSVTSTTSSLNVSSCVGAGGITVGCIDSEGPIENCVNEGTITAENSYAGGIIAAEGYCNEVLSCYNTGDISRKVCWRYIRIYKCRHDYTKLL